MSDPYGLAGLLVDGVPAFSAEELGTRRRALLDAAAERGVDRVLVVGVERVGTAVGWLTGWSTTREAWLLVEEDRRDRLHVGFFNHVPQARELARDADVGWVGPSAVETVLDDLRARGPLGRLGLVGPLPLAAYRRLVEAGVDVVDMGGDYVRLRQLKSEAELDFLRAGARLSDAGAAALRAGPLAGRSEWELADLVERAYVPHGGTTQLHYFGVTSMADPRRSNPAQQQTARRVRTGDVVVVELSAAFGGYAGQVLRSYAVGAEPTPLFAELHAVAEAAFDAVLAVLRDGTTPAQVQQAASVIEDAGFTTVDDLLHGFGGGYLPPVLGSRSRDHDPDAGGVLRAGMTVVVQPNPVTPDGRAGVQHGELVHVTATGAERLHAAPGGFPVVA